MFAPVLMVKKFDQTGEHATDLVELCFCFKVLFDLCESSGFRVFASLP